MASKLEAGDRAPDFSFDTPWQSGLSFYTQAGDQTSVLVFLRYLGCPVCQMEMARLKREIDRFQDKGAAVFVVIQSETAVVRSRTEEEDWPFVLVCDPEASIFRQYGVEPGGVLKYLHPAGLVAAVRATAKGFRHGKFEGNETQVPAAFVISSRKKIEFAHYGKTISDVPSPEQLSAQIHYDLRN